MSSIDRHAAGMPRVSCVVATRARPEFLRQSIRYFQAQDYPERDLIIVYEDDRDLPPACTDDPRVFALFAEMCRAISPCCRWRASSR